MELYQIFSSPLEEAFYFKTYAYYDYLD